MLRCLGKRSKQVKEQEDEAKKPFEGRKESGGDAPSSTPATATSAEAPTTTTETPGTKLSPQKSENVAKTSLTPVKTDPPTDGRHSFLRAARSGNLQKVIEHLNSGIGIKTCDGNGLNALHLASKEGHLNVVQELLNRGAEVDARTKKGNTALHISCLAGRLEVATKLIDSGATVNAQSQNGFTPLYMAAQENHFDVVKHLLTKDANQTLATDDGFTPLAVALQQGHEQIVAVLLENDSRSKVRLPALHIAAKKDNIKAASLLLQQSDVTVDQQSASGFTPLHIAAHYGSANVASLLLEHNADVNYQAKNNITPLHVASKWGKVGVVKLLLDANALPDCKTRDGLTPLHCATRSGHDRVCEELLKAKANFSAKTRSGLSPLHMAAQGDHTETTRVLLSAGANMDETTVDYLTPLHVAAHCGNVRVAKLFLDWNCQVNSRALNGFTPLHIACKKNWTKVIELLLKHGALVEATTESGLTPLHVAAFMGHMNIVVLLLQHGANVNSTTMRGETPLHLATRSGQLEIVRILLRNKPVVDAKARENQTPLHIASRLGNVDLAGVLLQHGANPENVTKDNYNCLHIAAKEGHEEIIAQLLEHGAPVESITKKGFTPLHIAAKYGRMPVCRLLLSKGAQPNAQGQNGLTALHLACHYNNSQIALLLLENQGNPHVAAKNGYTPLHIAAKKNEMDIAINLLEYGAESNTESRNGFTPLHLASQEGHTDMISLLLQNHANSNFKAKNGLTALHLAAQEDRVPVAEILVVHEAEIAPPTKAGYTPLHTACHFGQANMIRYLLNQQAPVDIQTVTGYTPLHLAAQQGHLQVVRLLVDAGANPNVTNENGWTAAHVARRQHYLNIFEVLRKITTVVESWEEIEEEIMTTVIQPAQPDTLHEHAFSESEDEGGTPKIRKRSAPGRPDAKDSSLQRDENLKPSYDSFRMSASNEYLIREMEYRLPGSNLETEKSSVKTKDMRKSLDSVSRMESRLSTGNASGTSLNSSLNSQDTGEIQTVNIHEIYDDEVTESRKKLDFKSEDENKQQINEDFMVSEMISPIESAANLKSPSGDNDFIAMPSSPLFARNSDIYRPYYEGLSSSKRSLNERQSTASGEDSIHENLVALDNRDLNFSIRTSEIEDDMQRSSALFAELPPKPELDFTPDNVPIQRKPVSSGPVDGSDETKKTHIKKNFLVSFLVDARGGSLSCSRHSGLRLIVPPGAASGPVRVICRMLRQDKVPRPPNLNDGEGLACRIMEMGPNHIKFNGPILLEVPHYAAIRGREREVIVFRSDNGDVWKEHNVTCNDQVISDTFGHGFDKLETCDELAQKRIIRILTTDFPQYFALISRVRQDSGVVGPDGGVLSSTVVPQVQAVFPENALMKRTRVGLQAQTISTELVSKLVGNRVAVSPIVTIEPRRRQFHKPITLTIPSPQAVSKGMINPPADGKEFNLRLLCSITGGYSPATWEDITGSMPLSVVKDCVSFTTKLSARFWLIHCQNVQEVTEMGGLLYREASLVPYVGKFVMFCRRHDPEEAQLRAFCITDDKVDKTLECHEGFELKAASPEVEVLHNRPVWLETAGNLIPVTKTGQQLQLPFTAFTENRLSFLVRVKDPHQDPVGKIAFMKDSRGVTAAGSGSPGDAGAQKPLCTLEVRLPDQICTTGRSELRSSSDQSRMISSSDLESWKIMVIETETIAKTELDLREIAEALGCDWSLLARELDVPQSDITQLKLDYRTDLERAFAMLILWRKKQEDKATGNALERGLRRIGREDVVKICMRNIEYVTTEDERAEATARMSMPSLTSETHEDQKEINETDGTSTPIELETLVAEIDSRRGVIQAPHSDEENESSQARTEAYLKLIDQLEATLPSEEEILAKAGLDDTDYQNGGEVEEDSVEAQQRETAPASDLSPLLEKISTKPAFAMAPEGEKEEEEEEEENGVIRPTKMKALHAARDFMDTPSIQKTGTVDPVAEVAFDPTRLEKDQSKLDFDSGVEEEPLSLTRQRGLHSAPPRSDSEEKTPEPDDKESLSQVKQRGLHSAAPPIRRDSLSSESSNEEDFVDAEEKRGVSQEPELILDRGMTRGSTEESDRFGMETSDLELSMYGPSDATSSVTMTASGISRITPPRSSGVQSDEPDDNEFEPKGRSRTSSSSSSVSDAERSKTPTRETQQFKRDPSSEDEEMTFQRAYEAAVKYGSSDDPEVDHRHHDVKETHQIIYGKPEERSQIEEIEEELEDGTIIKRKIVKKQVIQKVTDRIIREGCPEALAAHAAMDEAAFAEESEDFVGKGAPKTTVEVEEFEETLPDGSVVQRRVEHTTVAEEVTIGDDAPEKASFSDNLHPVNDPEIVQEVREELPDGSIVIKRIVRQTHCHEHDEGDEVVETTTLDEGPIEECAQVPLRSEKELNLPNEHQLSDLKHRNDIEIDTNIRMSADMLDQLIAKRMCESGLSSDPFQSDRKNSSSSSESKSRKDEGDVKGCDTSSAEEIEPEPLRQDTNTIDFDVEGDSETEERNVDRGDGTYDIRKVYRRRTLQAKLTTVSMQGDSEYFKSSSSSTSRLFYSGQRRCKMEMTRSAHDDQNTPRVEEFSESMADGSEIYTTRSHYERNLNIRGKVVLDLSSEELDVLPSLISKNTEEESLLQQLDEGGIPKETKPSKADLSSSDLNMEEVVETMAAADSSISLTNTHDIQHDSQSLIIEVKPSLGVSPSEQFKSGIVSRKGDEEVEEIHPAADESYKTEQGLSKTEAPSEAKPFITETIDTGLSSPSKKDKSDIKSGISDKESSRPEQDNTLLQRSHSPTQYEDESSELSSEMSASASASETETEETDEDVLKRPDTSAFKLPLFECGIRPDDLFSPTKDGSGGRVGPFQLMIASEHSVHRLEEKLDSPAQSPVDAYKSLHATLKREDDSLDGITEEERTRSPSISSETKDTCVRELDLESQKELEPILTPKAQTPVSDRQSIVSSLESTSSAVPVDTLRAKADSTNDTSEKNDVTVIQQANIMVADNLKEAQKVLEEETMQSPKISLEKEKPYTEKQPYEPFLSDDEANVDNIAKISSSVDVETTLIQDHVQEVDITAVEEKQVLVKIVEKMDTSSLSSESTSIHNISTKIPQQDEAKESSNSTKNIQESSSVEVDTNSTVSLPTNEKGETTQLSIAHNLEDMHHASKEFTETEVLLKRHSVSEDEIESDNRKPLTDVIDLPNKEEVSLILVEEESAPDVVSVSQPQIAVHETSKSETIAQSPEESVTMAQEQEERKAADIGTKTTSHLESEISAAPVTSSIDQTEDEKVTLVEEPETSKAIVEEESAPDVVSVTQQSQIAVHETSKSETIAQSPEESVTMAQKQEEEKAADIGTKTTSHLESEISAAPVTSSIDQTEDEKVTLVEEPETSKAIVEEESAPDVVSVTQQPQIAVHRTSKSETIAQSPEESVTMAQKQEEEKAADIGTKTTSHLESEISAAPVTSSIDQTEDEKVTLVEEPETSKAIVEEESAPDVVSVTQQSQIAVHETSKSETIAQSPEESVTMAQEQEEEKAADIGTKTTSHLESEISAAPVTSSIDQTEDEKVTLVEEPETSKAIVEEESAPDVVFVTQQPQIAVHETSKSETIAQSPEESVTMAQKQEERKAADIGTKTTSHLESEISAAPVTSSIDQTEDEKVTLVEEPETSKAIVEEESAPDVVSVTQQSQIAVHETSKSETIAQSPEENVTMAQKQEEEKAADIGTKTTSHLESEISAAPVTSSIDQTEDEKVTLVEEPETSKAIVEEESAPDVVFVTQQPQIAVHETSKSETIAQSPEENVTMAQKQEEEKAADIGTKTTSHLESEISAAPVTSSIDQTEDEKVTLVEEPETSKAIVEEESAPDVVSVTQQSQIAVHETSKSETIAQSPEESVTMAQKQEEEKAADIGTKTTSHLESEISAAPVTSSIDQTEDEKVTLVEEPETSKAIVEEESAPDVVSVTQQSQIAVHETSKSETIAQSPEESVMIVSEEKAADIATKTSLMESLPIVENVEELVAVKPEIEEQPDDQILAADVCAKASLLQRSQLPSEDILQTDDELEVPIAEDAESDEFSPHPDTDDRPRVCAEQMFHTAKEGDDRSLISPFEVDSSCIARSQKVSIEEQVALVETTSTTAGESQMVSTAPEIKEKETSPTILSDGGEEMSDMVMLESLEMSTDHYKESPGEIFQQSAEVCEEVEESADLFAISSPEEEKVKMDPLIVSYAEAIVDTAVDTAVNAIIESKDETSEVLTSNQRQVVNADELVQPVTPIQPSSDTINVDSHETVIGLCESVSSTEGLQVTSMASHEICTPSDIKDEDDFESDDVLVEIIRHHSNEPSRESSPIKDSASLSNEPCVDTEPDIADISSEIPSKSDVSSMKEKSPVRRISITEESLDDGSYVDMIDDIKEHVAIQEETSDLVQLQSSDVESETELHWDANKSLMPAATQQLMDDHEMIIERTEADDPHAMQTIQEMLDDIPQSAQSSETGIDSDTLGVVETTVSHSHESESGMTESGMTLDGFEMPTEENFERDRSFTPFDSEEPQSSGISVSESNLPSQSTLEVVTDSGFVLLGETATYMPAATDSQMSENIMEDSHLQTDVSTSIASDSTMHDDEFPRKSICTPDLVDEALTHESDLISSPITQTGQDDQFSAFQADSKESIIDRNENSIYPGSLSIESKESSHQSVILEPESPDFHEARILDDDEGVVDERSVRKDTRQPVVIPIEETRDSRIMEDLKEDTEGELHANLTERDEGDDEEEDDEEVEEEDEDEEEDEEDEDEEEEEDDEEEEEDDDDIVEDCEDGFKVIIRREPTHPIQDVDVEESTLSPIPECRESLESSPESYGKGSSADVTKSSAQQSSRSLGHLPISESADDLGDNSTSIGSFTTVIHPESLEGDQEGRLAVISGDKRQREGSHDQTSGTISSLESDLEIVSKSDFDLPQTGSTVVGLTDATTASKTSVQSEPIPVTIRSVDSLPLSSPGVSATAVASNTKEPSSLTSSLSEFERLEGETTLQGSEQSMKTTDSSGSDRQRQDAPPSMTSSLAEFERLEKELDGPSTSSPQQQKQMAGELELSSTSLNEFETLERQCDLGGAESQSFGSKEEEEMSDSSDSSSSSSSLADFVGLEESLLSEELSIEANKIVQALESGELPTAPRDDTASTENVINISNRVCSGDSISEAEVMSPMRESVSFGDSVSRIQELLTAGNSSTSETIEEKQRIEQDEPITAEMAISSYSEGNVDEADSLEEDEGEAPFHEDVSVVSAIPATRRPTEHDGDSLGGHDDLENSEHSRRSREVDSDSLGGGEDVMEESLTSMSSSIMQVSVDSLHAPMVSSGVIRVAGNLMTTEPDVMEENEEVGETRQPEVNIPPGMETSVDSLEQFQMMERSVDSLDEAPTASAPFIPRTGTSGVMERSTDESHSVQSPQTLSIVTAAGNIHPASESPSEAKTLPSHHSSIHSLQSQPSSLPQQSPAHIPPSTSLAPDHGSCDPTSKSGRD